MDNYYTQQIITYMGNKRKVLPHIEEIINIVRANLGKDKLSIADGFSGSGIVSRLFKNYAQELYINRRKKLPYSRRVSLYLFQQKNVTVTHDSYFSCSVFCLIPHKLCKNRHHPGKLTRGFQRSANRT